MKDGYVIVGGHNTWEKYSYLVLCGNNHWVELGRGKGKVFTEFGALRRKKRIKDRLSRVYYTEIIHTSQIEFYIGK